MHMTKQQYSTPKVLRVEHYNLMAEGPVTIISGVVDDVNDARRFNDYDDASWETGGQISAPSSVTAPWN